jgi:glucose/arabinose dehydrogenase
MVMALAAWSGPATADAGGGAPLVARARFPSAMAPLPDGGLLFGERATGRVRRVGPDGRLERTAVAGIEVSTRGQRGLLGLAVDDDGGIFAAWTNPAERLVVARIAPGERQMIWRGPPSSDRANGGRLAIDPRGAVVVGVGDLEQRELVEDPSTPNGKLLRLDPGGGPGQTPEVISTGWNNPFAFAFSPAGHLWVADNAPGKMPERLTRGDETGPVTTLPSKTVPAGLAFFDDAELLVCGFGSGRLQRYQIRDDRAIRGGVLARDCRLGVAVLADATVVYATERAIRRLPPDSIRGSATRVGP